MRSGTARCAFDLEARRANSRVQLEHLAAGEDHREAVDPRANGAVLEGGCTGRARRDRATGDRTKIRGHRRQPAVGGGKRILKRLQRHTGPGANAIAFDLYRGQALGAQDDVAEWRRATGQRRLCADGQNLVGTRPPEWKAVPGPHDLADRPRPHHACRMSARIVGGIVQEPAASSGVLLEETHTAILRGRRPEERRLRRCVFNHEGLEGPEAVPAAPRPDTEHLFRTSLVRSAQSARARWLSAAAAWSTARRTSAASHRAPSPTPSDRETLGRRASRRAASNRSVTRRRE